MDDDKPLTIPSHFLVSISPGVGAFNIVVRYADYDVCAQLEVTPDIQEELSDLIGEMVKVIIEAHNGAAPGPKGLAC